MRLLMYHTIEEKMMHLKKEKVALFKAVVEGATGGKTKNTLTKEDFNFLLDV